MKKVSVILLMALSMAIFTSCGSKENANPIPKAITDNIISEMSTDTMVELTEDRVSSYYDIDLDKLEDYSIYIEGSGGFADEVAVFKAKSTDDIEEIKTSITDRIDNQNKAFDGYNSEELVKIKDNIVLVNDNYILFVISEDNDNAEEIFRNSFK